MVSTMKHGGPHLLTIWKKNYVDSEPAESKNNIFAYKRQEGHLDKHVSLSVKSKMVRAGKAAVTVWALKWFDSSVFTEMSSQFIRAGKLPCASFPSTLIRLFPCMCPSVCL